MRKLFDAEDLTCRCLEHLLGESKLARRAEIVCHCVINTRPVTSERFRGLCRAVALRRISV